MTLFSTYKFEMTFKVMLYLVFGFDDI